MIKLTYYEGKTDPMERELLLLHLRDELNRKMEELCRIRSDIEKLRDKLEDQLQEERKSFSNKED